MKKAKQDDSSAGGQIRRQRLLKKLTQRVLAVKAGLPPQHIRKYESGAMRADCDSLGRIAAALNISAAELAPAPKAAGGDGAPEPETGGALPCASEETARHPGSVDEAIGAKIRAERKRKGITLREMSVHLGITYQQIQKYEKGSNRLSVGYLFKISEILNVPVSWLLSQSGDEAEAGANPADAAAPEGYIPTECAQLVAAFQQIGDPQVRRRIIDLVKSLSGGA